MCETSFEFFITFGIKAMCSRSLACRAISFMEIDFIKIFPGKQAIFRHEMEKKMIVDCLSHEKGLNVDASLHYHVKGVVRDL